MQGLAVSPEGNLEGVSSPHVLSCFKGSIARDMKPQGLYWGQRTLMDTGQARGLPRRDWHLFLPAQPPFWETLGWEQ